MVDERNRTNYQPAETQRVNREQKQRVQAVVLRKTADRRGGEATPAAHGQDADRETQRPHRHHRHKHSERSVRGLMHSKALCHVKSVGNDETGFHIA